MPIDIATALTGLKTAADLVGTVRKAIKDRDLKPEAVISNVLEIQELISDARSGLIEAQEEIAKLNGEIRDLNEKLAALQDMKENLEFCDNMYWHKDTHEGPFCPTCVDADKRLVRLVECSGHYECRVHNQTYLTAAQRKEATRPLLPRFISP